MEIYTLRLVILINKTKLFLIIFLMKLVSKDICDNLHFKELEKLLFLDSKLELTQDKWIKDIF